MGELGGLTQHLNIKPQEKADRMTGCQLAKITCAFCSDNVQRKDLKEHEEEICTKRPYNCEYCEDYKSIFEDVTTNHWPECRSRPVPCPNECGASPKLELLDDHVEECPLQVIDCPFEYAGCKESLLRKDMPDHITQSLALHMSLQATSHQQELKKLTSRISELEATVQLRELEVKNLLQGVVNQQQCKTQVSKEIKQAQEQALNNHPAGMEIRENRSDIEQEILKHLKSIVHNFLAELVPFSFSMPDFEHKKSTNSSWYSTSFYTHPRGYKMCLRVEANGLNDGKNSHVSVYLCVVRGEYDESLKWPFRGAVTVQLLNQLGGDEHHTKIIPLTDKSDYYFKRAVLEERSSEGWGFHDFISQSCLLPNYLKDDCLKFCVKNVKVNTI